MIPNISMATCTCMYIFLPVCLCRVWPAAWRRCLGWRSVGGEGWWWGTTPDTTVSGQLWLELCRSVSCELQDYLFPLHLLPSLSSSLSRFAQLTAAIFLNKNFKVQLFSEYTSTPYTVRYLATLSIALSSSAYPSSIRSTVFL